MHISLRVVSLVMVLLLSGCTKPTLDGSSEDDFYRSAGRVAQALPTEERDAFTDALMMVVMANVDFTAGPGETDQLDLEAAMARLDGMTIDQVMAEADALRRRHGAGARRGASWHDGPLDHERHCRRRTDIAPAETGAMQETGPILGHAIRGAHPEAGEASR